MEGQFFTPGMHPEFSSFVNHALSNRVDEMIGLLDEHPQLVKETIQTPFGHGSALHAAVSRGHVEAVKLLLDRNADVNIQDAFGITPLHGAALTEHIDVIELLFQRGADYAITNNNGETPLKLCKTRYKENGAAAVERLMSEYPQNNRQLSVEEQLREQVSELTSQLQQAQNEVQRVNEENNRLRMEVEELRAIAQVDKNQ